VRKNRINSSKELQKRWPLMTLLDLRHMQNDWQLLPLVLWRMLDPTATGVTQGDAVTRVLRDIWGRPDPEMEDLTPGAKAQTSNSLSTTPGFVFGRVYEACIVRLTKPTVKRLTTAFQDPKSSFNGIGQSYFIRNFQVRLCNFTKTKMSRHLMKFGERCHVNALKQMFI